MCSAMPMNASPERSRIGCDCPEFPDLVLDGMTISGDGLGARRGAVYLRGE